MIGYTPEHAREISVEPQEAPEHYVLDQHKSAMKAATTPGRRQDISNALKIIAKDRNSSVMMTLAENGQTMLTPEEAYAALSAPQDSIDEGLIM